MITRKLVVLSAGLLMAGMLTVNAAGNKQKPVKNTKASAPVESKVTFVELGSVNCVPCKMMQPVMKEIEDEYGSQVKVVFYDVWTEAGRPYGDKYKIRAIPTQVFLDKEGKEFFRHEGFYPAEEIAKVLEKQGVKKTGATAVNSSQDRQNDANLKQGEVCK